MALPVMLDCDPGHYDAMANPVAQCVAGLLDSCMIYHRDPQWGFAGAPLHDPCTITFSELFHWVECRVYIETDGPIPPA